MKEGVVGRVRKHNVTLMNEQGQYKEAYIQSGGERAEGEIGGAKLLEAEASRGGDSFARKGGDG